MQLTVFLVISLVLSFAMLCLVWFGVGILKDIAKGLEHVFARVDLHEERLNNHETRIKGLENAKP